MNFEQTYNASQSETNPLYIRMRSRFDFSGNRTIGEFMMMKAIREGYQPLPRQMSSESKGKRTAVWRRPLISVAALLLSCALFVFCAVNFIDAVIPDEPVSSLASSGQPEPVKIHTLTDESVVRIVFPSDSSVSE